MLKPSIAAAVALTFVSSIALVPPVSSSVDWQMVAKIREEGLQHSQVMRYQAYMTDVLGARLTMSNDMLRAQDWLLAELRRIGLSNARAEPFMNYGVTWDNEYVSLHMLAPDYQPMVGYPVAHTAGTDGKQALDAVVVDIQTRHDFERYRGTLRGKAVLTTPPANVDLVSLTNGVRRYTQVQLDSLERITIVPTRAAARSVRNPDVVSALEKIEFYKQEGAIALLQSESGWLGAVRAFSRPGAREDGYSRAGMLASLPTIAVTPEHYNRMYRILSQGVPVKVEIEVRNRIGDEVQAAANILAEIPGSDESGEIVMIGAHFDTWHGSPNASDNTSGVAVALEAMRILKTLNVKPKRTIRVALWSGEEQGLFGSRAYVRQQFGDPRDPRYPVKAAHSKLSAYFNQDYGAGQFRGIYLQGNESAREMLTAWMAPFRDLGMTFVSNQSLGSTDHVAFDEVGLPGFQFLQDRTPGTGGHSNLDFLEAIQPEDLMKNATIMASYAYHAAMADQLVPRKSVKGAR